MAEETHSSEDHQVSRRRATVDPGVGAMVIVFAVVALLAVSMGRPWRAPDSAGYRTPGRWLDFSLTSLTGRSVRPWGVTAWMALWPSDQALVLADAVLSVVAWATLVLVVARMIERAWVRRGLAALLLLAAGTAQVLGWDLSVLSAPVSISTGVLALAAVLAFAWAPSWRRCVLFLLAALWFTMTRPDVFPILLLWAVALVVAGLRAPRRLLWILPAVALVVFSAYTYVYNARSDAAWQQHYGVSRSTIAYAYPVGEHDPVATDVIAALRHSDLPACMLPSSPREVYQPRPLTWVQRKAAACPGGDAWLTKNWYRWWASWLLSHPTQTVRIIRAEIPNSLTPPVFSDVVAPSPAVVSGLVFGLAPGGQATPSTYRTQPLLLWLLGAACISWLARRRSRPAEWPTTLLLWFGIVGAFTSVVVSLLLIQSTRYELGEESVAATVVITTSCIVLVALGLDRLLRPGEAAADVETSEPAERQDDPADQPTAGGGRAEQHQPGGGSGLTT